MSQESCRQRITVGSFPPSSDGFLTISREECLASHGTSELDLLSFDDVLVTFFFDPFEVVHESEPALVLKHNLVAVEGEIIAVLMHVKVFVLTINPASYLTWLVRIIDVSFLMNFVVSGPRDVVLDVK